MESEFAKTGNGQSQSDEQRGRARGIMLGSLIAFGWAYYAASGLAPAWRDMVLALAGVIVVLLFAAGLAVLRRARALPVATATQARARRRVWGWFALNLAGEIVLLNIAAALLSPPHLRVFLIPAISAVVGLHFWPMAAFFRVRSYWWVGGAMMAIAALAAGFILRRPGDAFGTEHVEALANAFVLWSALVAGAAFALRSGPSQAAAAAEPA